MKIEIDDSQLIETIVKKVVEELKPLLKNNTTEENIIFTVETLAKHLEVSKQWVYERVHLNEIPFIKMGKFPRFKKGEIDKWLDSMKTPLAQLPSMSMQTRQKLMKIIK